MAKVNLDPRSHWGQGVDVRFPASGKQPEAVGHVRVSILWRHPLQEVAERLGLVVQLDEQHREALQEVDDLLNWNDVLEVAVVTVAQSVKRPKLRSSW